MSFQDVFQVLLSLGVSGVIVAGLSNWLGKVWASRILEKDLLRYNSELEEVKSRHVREIEQLKIELKNQWMLQSSTLRMQSNYKL